MKRRAWLFLLIIFFMIPVTGKALNLEFKKDVVISNACENYCDSSVSLLRSLDNKGNDDGYYLLTDVGLFKYDLDFNKVYEKSMDELDSFYDYLNVTKIYSSDDANVKGESDLLITLRDSSNNIIFEKLFGGNGYEMDDYYFPTFDNNGSFDGLVIYLYSESNDIDGVKAGDIVIKYDLAGNLLWKYNDDYYGNYVYDDKAIESMFILENKNIFREKLDGSRLWSVPDLQYSSNYKTSYNSNLKEDGIIIAGIYVYSMGCEMGKVVKYDLDGKTVFEVPSNSCGTDYYNVVNFKNEKGKYDGYLVLGTINNTIAGLFRYDSNGNYVEEFSNENGNTYFYAIESYNSNGKFDGYVVLGRVKNSSDLLVSKYTYPSFEIKSDNSDGGTIIIDDTAIAGELVKVKVVVKDGYSLQRIVVKDENGKEIEVNSDGTFIMPEGKVTVSAIYKRLTNPDTVSAAYMVLGVILIASVGSMIVIKKRNINY